MTVWDPVRDFVSLRDAMDRLVEDSYVRTPQEPVGRPAGMCRPRVDAWEENDVLVVAIALPGVNPDDVDVTYEKDQLVVSGEFVTSPELEEESERDWLIRERPFGPFQRKFAVNVPLDIDSVTASYSDGILTLRLPKSEETKPRRIAVSTG
jgi:HSP20 family protein